MSIYSETVPADRATIRFPQSSMVTKNSKAAEVVAAGFYDQKNKKVLGFFSRGHKYFYWATSKNCKSLQRGFGCNSDGSLASKDPHPIYEAANCLIQRWFFLLL
jgi:hypothetical protein